MYAISCYIGPRYNGTWLYLVIMVSCRGLIRWGAWLNFGVITSSISSQVVVIRCALLSGCKLKLASLRIPFLEMCTSSLCYKLCVLLWECDWSWSPLRDIVIGELSLGFLMKTFEVMGHKVGIWNEVSSCLVHNSQCRLVSCCCFFCFLHCHIWVNKCVKNIIVVPRNCD